MCSVISQSVSIFVKIQCLSLSPFLCVISANFANFINVLISTMYVTNLPCQTFVTMIPILGFHMYWEGQREVAGDGFRITKILQWQDLPLQLEKM